ncbi:MAG: hypothetical protein COA67_03965 [Lutibacter sp.]|nr:MAG: hypothetical protein COA67_03965 [Lutibacter sp.]
MHILIIEDDKDIRDSYEKQIVLYNMEASNLEVTYELAINFEEAKSRLGENFDAVIIDLKLDETLEYKGRLILESIKTNLRYISYVITGNPEIIEEEADTQNAFFKIRVKGEDDSNFYLVLEEIEKTVRTGITKIIGKRGQIEKYLHDIFWLHLSNSVDLWEDDKRSDEEKEKSLLRYTLSHMQEYLDLSSTGGLEKYHPAEFYITEPVKKNIFTGDILITDRSERCVILTPACDIDKKNGTRKADKILTLRILSPTEVDSEYGNSGMSKTKMGKFKQIIDNKIPRYHFIPKAGSIEGGIIDFQDKYTISDTDLEERIEQKHILRIATISNPFLKDVISRYSSYYSRQGSPDFDSDELIKDLF